MKKNTCLILALAITIFSLTGCGSSDTSAAAPATTETVQETAPEPEVHEHEWVDATCTEPKTCATCGETEGEPLGHSWEDATYQKPKTCSVCGATEGEAIGAACDGITFASVNNVVDMPNELTDEHDEYLDQFNYAKVWFENYKTFESDDTHEAKSGYEWKTVDMNIAIGDDTEYTDWYYWDGWGFGEYYTNEDIERDKDMGEMWYTFTVNYNNEEYPAYAKIKEDTQRTEVGVDIPEFADKWGWSGEFATHYVVTYECLVPQGFDGCYCFAYDANEAYLAWEDFDDRDFNKIKNSLDLLENVVYFRMD